MPHLGHARSQYLATWDSVYPESTSINNPGQRCQLCHSRETGGNGWNYYGWQLRTQLNGQQSVSGALLSQVIQFIETTPAVDAGCNQPSNTSGITFLDKIRYNAQPGWSNASNNERRNNGNSVQCSENITPPVYLPSSNTRIDFPNSSDALSDPITTSPNSSLLAIDLIPLVDGFSNAVKVVTAPGILGSVYVVEQAGRIWRVDLNSREKSLFLDISDSLVSLSASFDERGLLGLAFHPEFERNGLFYTYQSEPVRESQNDLVDFTTLPPNIAPDHRSFVVEYRAADPSCNSAISRVRSVLVIDQPSFNHNGGDLAFDDTGALYIALGDGGGQDDRGRGHSRIGNGSDASNPLGSILRINPERSAPQNYTIPADNPFISTNELDEIYATGLRNPYRFSFDSLNGRLFVGDVGQNQIEEVNIVEAGKNYGWNSKEGDFFFFSTDGDSTYITATAAAGQATDVVDPWLSYDHDEGLSVIGGQVYRGSDSPALVGQYIFADYTTGFTTADGGRLFHANSDTLENPPQLNEFSNANTFGLKRYTGFGTDSRQELYVLASSTDTFSPLVNNSQLYRIVQQGHVANFPDATDESSQCQSQEICFPIIAENKEISVVCL